MTMSSKDFKKIAEAHANIWFVDDERDYNILEDWAEKLISLVKPDVSAKNLAEKIRLSYEIYGALDDGELKKVEEMLGYKPENYIIEVYDKYIRDNFSLIYSSIQEKQPEKQAELHSKWWKVFFLKDQSKFKRAPICISAIFRQHKIKVGCNSGVKTAYYLIQAGRAHNIRDFNKCVDFLQKYWREMWHAGGRISRCNVLNTIFSSVIPHTTNQIISGGFSYADFRC